MIRFGCGFRIEGQKDNTARNERNQNQPTERANENAEWHPSPRPSPPLRWPAQLVKALAEYRRGRFGDAINSARQSLADSGVNYRVAVSANAVLAMAQHKQDQSVEARQTLDQALELSESKLPKVESGDLGINWPRWLTAHILLREARSVTEQKRPGVCLDEGFDKSPPTR